MHYTKGDKIKITFNDEKESSETADVIHVLGTEVIIRIDTERYVTQRLVQGSDTTKDVFGFIGKVTKIDKGYETEDRGEYLLRQLKRLYNRLAPHVGIEKIESNPHSMYDGFAGIGSLVSRIERLYEVKKINDVTPITFKAGDKVKFISKHKGGLLIYGEVYTIQYINNGFFGLEEVACALFPQVHFELNESQTVMDLGDKDE